MVSGGSCSSRVPSPPKKKFVLPQGLKAKPVLNTGCRWLSLVFFAGPSLWGFHHPVRQLQLRAAPFATRQPVEAMVNVGKGHHRAAMGTMKLVMGEVIDFFRPRTSSLDLCAMLTSSTNHLWAPLEDVPFVQPAYFTDVDYVMGGSRADWPRDYALPREEAPMQPKLVLGVDCNKAVHFFYISGTIHNWYQ